MRGGGDPEKGYTLSENSSLLLDLLRALASQAVVVGHGISYFGIWRALQPPAFPYIQNLAVVVFFALSGFLITYATLRKPRGFSFSEFFIDRFARIYSAYLVVLVLVWIIDLVAMRLDPATYVHAESLDLRTFAGNVAMLQDHPLGQSRHTSTHGELVISYAITSFGSARPFWTLAIEWWIYMCFGWIVMRDRARSSLVFFLVLAVLAIVPAYNILNGRGNGLALVWIFGAAAYVIASARRVAEIRTESLALAALGFAALSTILLWQTKEPYDVKYGALFGAAMLCAVLAVDRVRWTVPAFAASTIRFVANYSFTLYLVHYSILDLIAHHPVLATPTGNFLIAIVCTNAVSIVIAHFTEVRHRAFSRWLKARLLRQPSRVSPP